MFICSIKLYFCNNSDPTISNRVKFPNFLQIMSLRVHHVKNMVLFEINFPLCSLLNYQEVLMIRCFVQGNIGPVLLVLEAECRICFVLETIVM
jgi:hypothetical protein